MKSRKKWLQASRRRQARLMVPRRPHKGQLGKVSCEAGIARKSKMKKEEEPWREGDQMAAQCDEEQTVGRRSWNEEGWKEAP